MSDEDEKKAPELVLDPGARVKELRTYAAAFAAVTEALQGFTDEEALRILRAVAILHGVEDPLSKKRGAT